MEIIKYFFNLIKIIISYINTIEFIVFFLGFIIIFHFLLYNFKDKKYLGIVKSFNDPEDIRLENLKDLPLVNFIIPAWNKGKTFENCLLSIIKLKYPRLKVIINAGGSDETIKIAKSFEKHDNFVILKQEKGPYLIQGQNKIRALNQCFEHVFEGILFLIDADCYLTDEILLRMIYPIINDNEKVVCSGVRPLFFQENKSIVKYIHINRLGFIYNKFSRHTLGGITGANACLSFDVINKIRKFTENKLIIEEISRGRDLANYGFYSYNLIDYRSCIYTEYPNNLRELYRQRKRYTTYHFLYSLQTKKIKHIFLTLLIFIFSIYILVLPILFFVHLGFFFIGLFVFLNVYFKKIRNYLGFRKFVPNELFPSLQFNFFLKMLVYAYIEIIFNIRIILGIIPFILRYKKKKKINFS